MRLGEAYVNVRADLKPYNRDLQAGLKATTEAFEKQLNRNLGKRFGREISDGAREELVSGAKRISDEVKSQFTGMGIEREIRTSTRRGTRDGLRNGFWDGLRTGADFATLFASALASALDDGISALPVQVKAAIVAGLLAASPVIISQLGAAVSAGIAVGVAAGGIALASQLQPVQDAFAEVMEEVRNTLTQAAGPLIDPIIAGLEFLLARVRQEIGPTLNSLFTAIGPGVQDLFLGFIAGFEAFTNAITRSGLDINKLLSDVGGSVAFLASSLGKAFEILLAGGEDTTIALRDLTRLLSLTVIGVAVLVRAVTELYGRIRTIVSLIQGDFAGAAQSILNRGIEDTRGGIFNLGEEYGGLTVATDAQTKAWKEQEKAIEDARKAMDDLVKSEEDLIQNRIDTEESWDRLKESVNEYGATLELSGEKGRENAENVKRFLGDVRTELQGLVDSGEITAEEAEAQYARQVTAAEKLFSKTRGGKKDFQELFAELINVSKFRLDPSPWTAAFNKIGNSIQTAINRLKELQSQAKKSGVSTNIKVPGGTQQFADGGRITEPTSAILGENYRPEIVLPESKPQRAAQILADSPLGAFLGGGATTVFAWFDGEPFQARMVRTANAVNRRNARTIHNVPRSI